MEKVYKYYKVAISEDSYRVHIDSVTQNNCFWITGFELINPESCLDLDTLFETLLYFYITCCCFYREKVYYNYEFITLSKL